MSEYASLPDEIWQDRAGAGGGADGGVVLESVADIRERSEIRSCRRVPSPLALPTARCDQLTLPD